MLSLPKKILFTAVIVFLFFTVFEIVLRIASFSYDPAQSTKVHGQIVRMDLQGIRQDPTLAWSWIPIAGDQTTIPLPQLKRSFTMRFNGKGFRGADFSEHKPADTVRIIMMGDSCTLGWGVDEDKTIAVHLQKILERRAEKKVEIINAGVLGFTSFQGLHDLQTRILRLQPDIVLLSYNWNDHLPAQEVTTRRDSNVLVTYLPDKSLPSQTRIFTLLGKLLRFRVVQFVDYLVSKSRTSSSAENGTPQAKTALVTRVALPDFKHNLHEMIRILRSHKINILLFTEASREAPSAFPRDFDKRVIAYIPLQHQYNEAIQQISNETGVPCVDTVAELEQYEESELYLDLVHKTARGNLIIATQLIEPVLALVENVQ